MDWAVTSPCECNYLGCVRDIYPYSDVFGSLEPDTSRTELFCRNAPQHILLEYVLGTLQDSKGLSLIYVEPLLHPVGFAELLLQMHSLATDGYQSLCQSPKTPMLAQVLKQQP